MSWYGWYYTRPTLDKFPAVHNEKSAFCANEGYNISNFVTSITPTKRYLQPLISIAEIQSVESELFDGV